MITIRKRADFLRIAKEGKRRPVKTFVLQTLPNQNGETRIGYTVSKRVSKRAVDRNRIKRRLRAAVKDVSSYFPAGNDYVIIGRIDAMTRDYKELKNDLKYALKKIFTEENKNGVAP